MTRFVAQRTPHVVSLGDVIERDGHREKVVRVGARDFVETVPLRRPADKMHLGTFTLRYAELAGRS